MSLFKYVNDLRININEAGSYVGGVREVSMATNSVQKTSILLSEYADKLVGDVKKRYEDKICEIAVDPLLVPQSKFGSECLPPVESVDLLPYLVLDTSYYTNAQFKAFQSLQAYNQMVSGFICSVLGYVIKKGTL